MMIEGKVASTTPSKLALTMPKGVDGQQYTVILVNPNGDKHTITITQKTANTPQLQLKTSVPVPSGTQTITLNRTSFSTSTNPTSISLYNTLNPKTIVSTATHSETGS